MKAPLGDAPQPLRQLWNVDLQSPMPERRSEAHMLAHPARSEPPRQPCRQLCAVARTVRPQLPRPCAQSDTHDPDPEPDDGLQESIHPE